jgi:uncharacterized protein YacL
VLDAGLGAGVLMVPAAVLEELQVLADMPPTDSRREKGRHGLGVAEQLRAALGGRFQVIEDPAHARDPVDNQVIRTARQYGAIIMTVDSNLEKVATIGDVPVCNPNTLLRACQLPWAAGDTMTLRIESQGRQPRQGVGHAPDGTAVIVDDAAHLVGSQITVRIRRIQNTQSGAVVFAAPVAS